MRPFLLAVPMTFLLAACVANPDSPPAPRIAAPDSPAAEPDQLASLPPVQVTSPALLRGLNSRQVTAVLGKPSFTRRDAPAEIWQYRVRTCTLDLFLYDNGSTQKVAHFAVRSPQPVSDQACFDEVLATLRDVPTS
jgi:hypothetical protein